MTHAEKQEGRITGEAAQKEAEAERPALPQRLRIEALEERQAPSVLWGDVAVRLR